MYLERAARVPGAVMWSRSAGPRRPRTHRILPDGCMDLIWRAENVLQEPAESLPHDDHLHLRIACSPEASAQGCEAGGPYWSWLPALPTQVQPPELQPAELQAFDGTELEGSDLLELL